MISIFQIYDWENMYCFVDCKIENASINIKILNYSVKYIIVSNHLFQILNNLII